MIWTFVRRHQRLEIRREPHRDGIELVVTGGDAPGATLFGDLAALVAHQTRIEARLINEGWSLASFEPERRSHVERRRQARATIDRRRWWTDPVFRASAEAAAALDDLAVRQEAAGDEAGIREVIIAAFGRPDEADLVERLRQEGAVLTAFVAEVGGAIVGHVMFTRAWLETANNRCAVAALAPLAVTPSSQRRGIAAALVDSGIEWLQAHDEQLVLVLGEPHYYARFGFSADAARDVDNPFPPAALMAMALVPGASANCHGRIRYADAFGL
jgi:putative acetyltransferase